MNYFDETYHPPRTPPGTLVGSETTISEALSIHLIDYASEDLVQKHLGNVDEYLPYLRNETVSWIRFQGQVQANVIIKWVNCSAA